MTGECKRTVWQTAPLPPLPEPAPDLDVLAVPAEPLREHIATAQDLEAVYWDRRRLGDDPNEHEMVAHFVVPLLRASGWPPVLYQKSAEPDPQVLSGLSGGEGEAPRLGGSCGTDPETLPSLVVVSVPRPHGNRLGRVLAQDGGRGPARTRRRRPRLRSARPGRSAGLARAPPRGPAPTRRRSSPQSRSAAGRVPGQRQGLFVHAIALRACVDDQPEGDTGVRVGVGEGT